MRYEHLVAERADGDDVEKAGVFKWVVVNYDWGGRGRHIVFGATTRKQARALSAFGNAARQVQS